MIGALLGLIAGVVAGLLGLSWWWLPAWAGGGFMIDLVARLTAGKPDSGIAEAFADCMTGIADAFASSGGCDSSGDSGGSSGYSCGGDSGGSGCGGGGCGGGGGD